jgi:hypothetical protein
MKNGWWIIIGAAALYLVLEITTTPSVCKAKAWERALLATLFLHDEDSCKSKGERDADKYLEKAEGQRP